MLGNWDVEPNIETRKGEEGQLECWCDQYDNQWEEPTAEEDIAD